MKKSAEDWLRKADGDAVSARREFRARNRPNYDSACFHAQQCVEKSLKAVLEELGKPVRKLHDLTMLMEAALDRFPLWKRMRDDLELLSQYAVNFRYPGADATRTLAQEALLAMERCRKTIAAGLKSKRKKPRTDADKFE